MIYKPEFVEQARTMCRLGATDEELAEHFEVCVRTIYRWRNTHEEFAEAVVVGKEHADARVERALYSRAVGCSVERTKVFKHAGDPKPVYATYTHHLPPDPVAALNWLRVRQPKKWVAREEKQSDPGAIEMIEKALARAAAYEPPYPWPPRQPPSEAAQLEPSPEPEPSSEPEPSPEPEPPPETEPPPEPDARPAPPPDPVPPPGPPPGPPTGHGDRHGYCSIFYPNPPG
jgi:hypothetical protein